MRHTITILMSLAILVGPRFLIAQQTGSSVQQTVTLEVKAITNIRVNGNPGMLAVVDPPSGPNEYALAVDRSTSYSLVTNLDQMKIAASISDPMPAGTKLLIALGSTKGRSTGRIDISNATTPVTAVVGVTKGSEKNQPISYIFGANASAGNIETGSRVVTLTVTD